MDNVINISHSTKVSKTVKDEGVTIMENEAVKENDKNIKFHINNLNLYYGDFHALKGINMEIPERQITAFIGPSGCGKSTFLKSLNRMNDLVENCHITGDVFLEMKIFMEIWT